jgi:immunity protein 5 of polymorphic toxin system
LTCSSRLGPEEPWPRHAIEQARAWVRGEITMSQARTAVGHANAAARGLSGAARHATHAADQAAAVAHVATHELGAAACGLKAAHAAAPEGVGDSAGQLEYPWQRDQLPEAIRELVLGDQRLRKRHLLVNA